jgi:hypothetical protein
VTTIDPHVFFVGLAGLVFAMAGFEVGWSFLMRGSREAATERDD